MKHVREIAHNGLVWVNVTKQGEKELAFLDSRFHFLKDDLGECLPHFQRPKMMKRNGYYFLVLHFPIFDRGTRRVGFTEVDIFLTASTLITVHDSRLPAIEEFFRELQSQPEKRSLYYNGSTAGTLFELLSRLFEAIFPSLHHINEDITAVDSRLFSESPDKDMASEILRLKTNVVTFRRAMQGHRTVLERLLMNGDRELQLSSYQSYINTLREEVTEIWHMLESQKESITALHETNESIISYRTNEVMKTLTIISVITFPLTLIATLFSIQASGTPFVNQPSGFWIIFGLIIFGALLMLSWFRHKRWV